MVKNCRLSAWLSVLYTSFSEMSHWFNNVLGVTPLTFKTVHNVWRKTTWSFWFVAKLEDILFVLKITLKLNLFSASLFLTIVLKSFVAITILIHLVEPWWWPMNGWNMKYLILLFYFWFYHDRKLLLCSIWC